MLERNVGGDLTPINSILMFRNLNSQRRTRSFKNTSFLGTNQVPSNPCKERGDPNRFTRRERVQVVVVEEGRVGVVEAVEAVGVVGEEEVQGGTPAKGQSKARTKLQRAITTGNGAMTRRWQERGPHLLPNVIVH
jgi:hypothetical protein